MKVKPNVTLVTILLPFLATQLVTAFCPYGCDCDDVKMTVRCPKEAELTIIPITLNPMIQRITLSENEIR